MIEKVILNHLCERLPDVQIAMERSDELEDKFVLIERTSGRRNEFTYYSMFAIQSYGLSMIEASELNERVINAMYDIVVSDDVVSVELNSTYNFTDTSMKEYRYQSVFDLVHY